MLGFLLYCVWPIVVVLIGCVFALGIATTLITVTEAVKASVFKSSDSSYGSIIIAGMFSALTLYLGVSGVFWAFEWLSYVL